MSKWISVSKRLPIEYEYVLLLFEKRGGYPGMAVGSMDKGKEFSHWPVGSYADDSRLFGVTHWMPLPSPPEDK